MPNAATDPTPPLPSPAPPVDAEACDWCGSPAVTWRKCKLVCVACGQIVKSCADL